MKTFLVTGANGFLGTHLIKELLRQGHRVIGIDKDDRTDGVRSEICDGKNFTLYTKDLAKEDLKIKQASDIYGVFHLAAQLKYSKDLSFDDYYNGNVETTRKVIKFAKENNLKFIIYATTCSVFGKRPKEKRINEGTPPVPDDNYGLTKYVAERLLEIELRSTAVKAFVCRFTSIFGANDRYGMVNTIWRSAQQKKDIKLFNNGKRHINLLYISDAVDLLLKIIDESERLGKYEEFIAGSKESISGLKLAEEIRDLLKSSSRIVPVDRHSKAEWDVSIDIKKAKSLLGFKPMPILKGLRLYAGKN